MYTRLRYLHVINKIIINQFVMSNDESIVDYANINEINQIYFNLKFYAKFRKYNFRVIILLIIIWTINFKISLWNYWLFVPKFSHDLNSSYNTIRLHGIPINFFAKITNSSNFLSNFKPWLNMSYVIQNTLHL